MSLDWKAQKARLHTFYIKKNMPLREVIDIMEDRYQFKATKSQYERKFKAWGFDKNMTDEHWKFVDRRMRKYGRNMEVSFNEVMIPEKKVKREISRHVSLVRLPSPLLSPATPEGLVVYLPTAPLTVDIFENLPWFRYRDFTELQVDFHSTSTRNSLIDTSRRAGNLNSWAALGENRELGLRQPARSWSPPLEEMYSSYVDVPQLSHQFADVSDILDNDMSSLQTFGSSNLAPTWQSCSHMPKRYFNGVFTQELFSAWQELVPVEPTSHLICTESLLEVISQLQDYIPERYDGEMAAVCDQLISSSTDRVFLSFLGYAVYLSTNNLLGSYQINAMLSLVLQSKYFHTMVSFLNSELPTIEAFSQKLLQAALHSCDKAAIEALLGACVDLALVGYSFGAEFQAAVRNNEFEVVQLLLRNGLDVNIKLPPMPELWTQNILASVSTLRIMQVLVEAGAYVNQPGFYLLPDSHFHWKTPLQHTSSVGDINRVRFLLQAGAEVNAPAFPRNVSPDKSVPGVTALMAAVEGNHLEVVELLLQSGADINQYSSFADCAKYQYMTNPYQSHYLLSFEADKEGHVEGTVLQIAAKSGNLELVQLLVKFGAHVDKRNQWKQHDRRPSRSNDLIFRKTALAEAAENGHYEVVELLLHAGADVNAEVLSKFGERIIHATNHHSRMRRLLLQSGAVEHAPSCIDLQLAVWRGDLERAEKLLSIGLDPDIRALGETDLGGCLMHMAVLRGHKTLVKLLLGKGARMDHPASLTTCLQAATLLNDFETVEVLCHAGADVNAITSATPCPPLQLCPLYEKDNDSNRDIFRCLLHCGANVKIPAVPSKQYGTPLQNVMAMAGRCDYDIVQELLSSGADVNARGAPFTALQQAIKRADPGDDYRIIRILLEAGADINQRLQANGTMGTTPFQMAIGMRHTHLDFEFEQFENHMKLVEFLLKSGADINAEAGLEIFTGSEARTALQEAADGEDADENLANQDSKLIQFLLKHGADVNAPPSRWRGRTALQAAAARQYCSIKIVQVLLEAGADVNGPACPSYGITALQGAAIQGHIKIAKMLLEAGAKVNAPGSKKEGRTALEGAAERGRLDMVQLLLNAGADTHLPIEKRYRSAAEFAKERHHFAIAKLLMSYAEG